MGHDGTKKTPGRGADFKTEKNPFASFQVKDRPALADHSDLGLILDALIDGGDAIIIGATRDGGALAFTVMEGDQRHRTYAATDSELDGALRALHTMYVKM